MKINGRLIQFIWWWSRPRWVVYRYPEWDMRPDSPVRPPHYWTGIDLGLVEIRIWYKGWSYL